ncbi:A24 family peptidase C-terminal domain-containing protein [Haloarcula sp. KBTZ06]|uniref:A24 family peptidase n=1 Tax=unclassified Haloarcula TaxID=2624677 RepID=UPI00059559E1|nr:MULTISPECIES: A24 family peptidase [unclassified Haloarcula]AJF25518.1 peptidase A24 [Haloarcula sp. CBA1115]KAA9405840.1 A24 family peptidase [Haloarcula sp. CBA1131]KZX46963.1 peptidase A24 [Haloarcula sp. K1]
MLGSIPDLLRLVAVPVFGWAAYRDVKTRRVPNRTWTPLAVLAVVLLLWDAYTVWAGPTAVGQRLFFIRVAISLGFVVPLSYGFWLIGGFGGADAKAFMLVAVLFPVYPVYYLPMPSVALPLQQSAIGVFSLTILSNTVLAGIVYPLAVAAGNLARGRFSLAMFIGRPVAAANVTEEYGRLLESPDGFDRGGLDLDALRMYLQWRGCSLADIRADPEQHRLPTSIPAVPNDPGDGSLATDGGDPVADDVDEPANRDAGADETDRPDHIDDPWGAEQFLDDIDHSAYGTSPAQLRDGLDVLAEQDEVWISPGIPFLVPMFAGLVVSLTYGDVLFSLLQAVGLA